MRLTCPNCKAQYEIDGSVIPEAGRDVQCSACGNTWYQYPASVEIAMRAADLEDDDDEHPEPGSAPAPASDRAAPRIDQSVLDVLREEAEREVNERRRSTSGGGLEMQGDLGLVTHPRANTASETTPRPAVHGTLAAERDEGADDAPRPGTRRNLLPDIEELSSTLQPGGEPRRKGSADTALPPTEMDDRRGFRQGLSLVLLVAILLVGLYALTPLIAQNIPALADPLAGYVALVDSLRASLSENLRALLARIAGNG